MKKWVYAAGCLLLLIGATLFFAVRHSRRVKSEPVQAYADPATCVQCHRDEAQGYARTGMAHAFSKADEQNTKSTLQPFYHQASQTYFAFVQHDGKYAERRWQQGFDGNPENVEELSIDYVMGSGNHARTYLHREKDGTLIELPLAWYAEKNGSWGMNPGFDSPHPMTRRVIAYECMFCHNAYPAIPPSDHRDLTANPVYGASLPEGIDCQRCHGPGAAHVKAAQTNGTSAAQVRSMILNPARLSDDRQMEVCEQCHLETTSRQLPDRIRHYDREPFGYRAGDLLASFNAYFEPDRGKTHTDNVEIVNSVYRLRQSQCYLKSQGALTCETCHDPHDLHKGAGSVDDYAKVCLTCHAAALKTQIAERRHTEAKDCVSCHMPKRRTDDVVHAVMTDHLIQRQAPPVKELLAERRETPDTPPDSYRGTVKRYLLDHEGSLPDDELYNALAQVIDSSNLNAGIPLLQAQLQQHPPAQPNAYIELGDALRHTGDMGGAISAYRDAAKRDPLSSRAQRRLGVALGDAGETSEAIGTLEGAIGHEPENALLWYEKARIEVKTGSTETALADLHKALELKPDFADADNSLGALLAQRGDLSGAEAAFRGALTVDPYDSGTRANLGRLLASQGRWSEAAFQLQKAAHLDNTNAAAHSDAALAYLQLNQMAMAETEAKLAVTADAKSTRAHEVLGQIYASKHAASQAQAEFEAALRLNPDYAPAQLDLAETFLDRGQIREAMPILEKASTSRIPAVAGQAQLLLQQIHAKR